MLGAERCGDPRLLASLHNRSLLLLRFSTPSLLYSFASWIMLFRVAASSLFRNADFARPPAAQKSQKFHSRKGSIPAQMGGNGILRREFRGRLTLFRLSQRSLENRKKCDGQGNLPVSLFEYINFSGCLLRLDTKITL